MAADTVAIIAKRVPADKRNLSMTDRLEDLNIDSFSAVEMIYDLEEKFDVEFPYNSNDNWPEQLQTVGTSLRRSKSSSAERSKYPRQSRHEPGPRSDKFTAQPNESISALRRRGMERPLPGSPGGSQILRGNRKQLDEMVPRVQQVMKQARARVFRGDTRAEGKILSVFEPSTEVIRKGKAAKPNEFGKMVKLQEAENQIVIDYGSARSAAERLGSADPGDRNASTRFGRTPLPCGGRRGLLLRQE